MKRKLTTLCSISLLVCATLFATPVLAQDDIIEELDNTLAVAEDFADAHRDKIASTEQMLQTDNLSLSQQYNIYTNLYNDYKSFQFDSALLMLNERERLAREMNNASYIADVHIDRAFFYVTAAMFFEAAEVLENELDTMHLDREQQINYYNTQQRFHSDFWHYTSDNEARNRSGAKIAYYRSRILELTPNTDPMHRSILVRNLTEQGEWEKADSVNTLLLADYRPDEHEYAMYSYDRARICEALDRRDEMLEWFARSAMADIRSATKDNASLCSLAQLLLENGDIGHAFRYITISLNDALFFNAKLRPWQIAGFIPEIEKAYHTQQELQRVEIEKQEQKARKLATIISILAVALLIICCYMAVLLIHSRRNAKKIREMNEHIRLSNEELQKLNERMKEINSDLREANTVKEEYIGLFLSMCSDYIEKLTNMQRSVKRKLTQGKAAELERELSSSSILEDELNNFYEMFDNAFLSLYPNFVSEFNALLKPECHVELKRGERLNTELRIFALIRLGITDSSRIASLLRYSVNTIYNYRARTKNNALNDRDSFEEAIKTIGR